MFSFVIDTVRKNVDERMLYVYSLTVPPLTTTQTNIPPSDMWTVGKELKALFELTTWHFDMQVSRIYFVSLQHYAAIRIQLLFSNNRNGFRWVVLGCAQIFLKFKPEQLKARPVDWCHFQPTSFLIGQYL